MDVLNRYKSFMTAETCVILNGNSAFTIPQNSAERK